MSQCFSRLARKVFKDVLRKWNLPVFVFQSRFCVINHFNFGLCPSATSCEAMTSGRSNDIPLWKTLRYLRQPIQDIRLNLASLVSQWCIYKFIGAERGGRESNIPRWWQAFQIHDCKGGDKAELSCLKCEVCWSKMLWKDFKMSPE